MRAHHPAVSAFSLLAVFFFLLALAGCSAVGIESKRIDYKSGSAKAPPLDVPPDLTALAAGDRYVIPDSGGETVTSFSEYSKGSPLRQQPAQPAVLPEVPTIRLERSGSERWLLVQDKPENVWPKVKAFWQENGFSILTDKPDAGLIETDWVENRAKIPQGGLRAVIGKVFDKLYSSGEKDSYRTRLERRKDDAGTEIHIRHRGMAEVFNEDKSTSKWQPRPNDPEMEASMLQMLMARLGGNAAAQSAVLDATSVPLGEVVSKLEVLEGGSKALLLNEPFDKCWRRVGLALESAGIVLVDKNRDEGVYFVSMSRKPEQKKSLFERLQFWRDEEASKPEPYQVVVVETNGVCNVSAVNKDDKKDEATTRAAELMYEQLKQ